MSKNELPAVPAANTSKSSPKGLASTIESPAFVVELKRCLASHMKEERFRKITLMAMRKNPKLQDCTPESFFASVLQCASIGLEPDGRAAHLVPFYSNKK